MYLAYYASDYSAKNKLEKAIRDYLKSIDRAVIQDEDFKEFTSKVFAKIEDINKDNKRCTPKKPHLWSGTNKDDKILGGIDVVNFYFYHSSKDYREGVIFIDKV